VSVNDEATEFWGVWSQPAINSGKQLCNNGQALATIYQNVMLSHLCVCYSACITTTRSCRCHNSCSPDLKIAIN